MCCRGTLFIQVKEIVTGLFGLVCKEKVSQVFLSAPPLLLPLSAHSILVRIRFASVTGGTAINRLSEYFLCLLLVKLTMPLIIK